MAKSFLNTPGLPLGLRNNNPGNIRPGDPWQGAIGTNQGFVVFKDIAYGIRALATDVGNDIRLDGLNTIRKLINEYAPPSENDTAAYIRSVATQSGIGADQPLGRDQGVLKRLLRAIINVENGQSASLVSDQDITEGVALVNTDLLGFFNISPKQAAGGGLLLLGLFGLWYFTRK